jgi:hypothetical protein
LIRDNAEVEEWRRSLEPRKFPFMLVAKCILIALVWALVYVGVVREEREDALIKQCERSGDVSG